MTGRLLRKEMKTQMYRGKGYSTTEAETGVMQPEVRGHRQPQEVGREEEGPSLEPSEEVGPCWHFDFRLPTSSTQKTDFCCLSQQVCDAFLWQPKETHTCSDGFVLESSFNYFKVSELIAFSLENKVLPTVVKVGLVNVVVKDIKGLWQRLKTTTKHMIHK